MAATKQQLSTGMPKVNSLDEMLAILKEARDRDLQFKDCGVTNDAKSRQIVLPGNMTCFEGLKHLYRHSEAEEREVGISKIYRGVFPLDGACALIDTINALYGWVDMKWGFMSQPTLVSVPVGPDKTRQVPWGQLQIPGINGYLETSFAQNGKLLSFAVEGLVQKKFEHRVNEILELTAETLKTHSIYKGQAIELNFRDAEGDLKKFNPSDGPTFMDLSDVNPEELIFATETQELIEDCLWTPIQFRQLCRAAKIPGKRTVLMEGPFGVGKTLGAYVTAFMATKNAWTFLYVKDCRDIEAALELARQYQPAVVFAEDIDRIIGKERTADVNSIMNVIDGVTSKNVEIITVLTTNAVESIYEGMLRYGRVDAVIPVRAPDVAAAAKLVNLYGRGLVTSPTKEVEAAVKPLVDLGSTASAFREVIERAKLSAVRKWDGLDELPIAADNVRRAASSMVAHQKLLQPAPQPDERPMSVFGAAVGNAIKKALKKDAPGAVVHANGNGSDDEE